MAHTGEKPPAPIMNSKSSLQQRLTALRADYLQALPGKIAEIERSWRDARGKPGSRAPLEELFRHAHNLKGSGATFGVHAVSAVAARLDECLRPFVERNQPLTDADRALLDKLIGELRACEREGGDFVPPASARPVSPARQTDARLLLIEDDHLMASELSAQLEQFGYAVDVENGAQGIAEKVRAARPQAILMDIVFDADTGGFAAAQTLQRELNDLPPIIFLSGREDVAARVAAVRMGGSAYFTKPVDVSALVDQLDLLSQAGDEEPYRILIVEDSEDLREFYACTLQDAGMEAQFLHNPDDVLNVLSEFSPELILMDMYMPHYQGRELAAVIRQESSFLSTPIVFLSSEGNLDRQLRALSLGADDFLTKPIQADHLVRAIEIRARRYRQLRRLMVRDSLTGLFNHTRIREQLATELRRAGRHGGPVAFAMIDIDHFKGVNDRYGHSAGDRVIKNLARLLRQRLRTTDAVGRYGGEEFAVVFEGADTQQAARVMEELRQGFGRMVQHAEHQQFSVTFSCGIAAYPDFQQAAELSEAADRALYRAKAAGRNRIVCA